MKQRLIIADDHNLFRNSLSALLKADDEFDVIDGVANGKELLEVLKKSTVDLVLTDLNMPVMNGLEVLEYLKEHYPDIRCLVVSMFNYGYSAARAIEAGARGVISKSADVDELKVAVRQVLAQGLYLNDKTAKIIFDKMMNKKGEVSGGTVTLTDKEIKIIKLISQEFTTAEIADQMFLSPRTIEGIRLGIIDKIHVKNSAGLVLYAVKNGLIEI